MTKDKVIEKYSNDHIQSMANEDAIEMISNGEMISIANRYLDIYEEDRRASLRYSTTLYDQLEKATNNPTFTATLHRIFRNVCGKLKDER